MQNANFKLITLITNDYAIIFKDLQKDDYFWI